MHVERRPARRGERDVLRRTSSNAGQRDDRRRPGLGHDHRRRSAAGRSRSTTSPSPRANRHGRRRPSPSRLGAASGQTVTVDYATANGTATAPGRLHRHQRHAHLHARADDADRHRARQRRPARRDRRDLLRQPHEPVNATIADAQGVGTIIDDDAAAGALDRRRDRHRGRTPARQRHLHGHALDAPSGRAGQRRLRDRRRHGDGARPTTRRQRHAHLRAGRDDEDGHGPGQRRHARRDRRDLLRQPLERGQRDDRRRPGRRHDHRRRRRSPTVSINDVDRRPRATAGTADATFTVTPDAASGSTVTVDYATADGTAHAPGRLHSGGGTLTFAPGRDDQDRHRPRQRRHCSTRPTRPSSSTSRTPSNATIADGAGPRARSPTTTRCPRSRSTT